MKRNRSQPAYMKLACSTIFVYFNYPTSFSNDDFSSFKNWAKESRLLRNDILSLNLDATINRPDLQTFTYRIKNKSKSCESQVQSPSHRFTGKSEQNIDTHLSHWNPREEDDGSTSSRCSWRNALW